MSSLMQSVLEVIQQPGSHLTEEECLASFDLDAGEISEVEGGWEFVALVDGRSSVIDRGQTGSPALRPDFFIEEPVYERDGYMFVRGMRMGEIPIWLVFEPSGTGVH